MLHRSLSSVGGRVYKLFLFGCLIALTNAVAFANTVTIDLPNKDLQAQARYSLGDPEKPVVLIVHGFLTTNNFHTVVAMEQGLQNMGVSTLSPTLTLGISQRKESVRCQSIHTHTLEEDIAEIQAWIDWLKHQGHSKFILLGHSSGSVELLEYLKHDSQQTITAAIFTSMFYLNGPELGTEQSHLLQAEQDISEGKKTLRKYSLLFCNKEYLATAESFLSYKKMTHEYVLSSLKALQLPNYTLMGGADKRYQKVGQDWLNDLQNTGTQLITIEGANHFFSSEYEFDLQDQISQVVEKFIPHSLH